MGKDLAQLRTDPLASDVIRKRAEEIMNFIFEKSQENLISDGSVDTGFLLRSAKPPRWEGNVLILEYDAPYAVFHEYGTAPHPVSPKHLIGWVRRKLKVKDKKAMQVAYAIAHKIKTQGTEPRPFIRPAILEASVRFDLKGVSLNDINSIEFE